MDTAVELKREDGSSVFLMTAPVVSHPSDCGSGSGVAAAIAELSPAAVVFDVDESRQAWLAADGQHVPMRPGPRDFLGNGLAKQRLLQLTDDALRLGLVPYGAYAAARRAAEEAGAEVVLGGVPLDNTLERIPAHGMVGMYMSNGLRDLATAAVAESGGSITSAGIDRAFYIYDHPEMRRISLAMASAEASMPDGWLPSVLGSKIYDAAVVDPARVLAARLREAPAGTVVGVVGSEAGRREVVRHWGEQVDLARAMRGGTFTDKYGTLLMSGAAVAVAVAAAMARRPRGYKGWYRGYSGAVRAKAQAQ